MADLFIVNDQAVSKEEYAAIVLDYVKNEILPQDASEEQVNNGYANTRIWLDSKGIVAEPIKSIEANKEEVIAIATGPDYAEVLESQGKTLPGMEEKPKPKSDFKKLAFLIAAMGLMIWLLFIKDSNASSE